MDTMDTNVKIILITAQKMETGMMRLELNVEQHAREVRYKHTQIVGCNYVLYA